MDIDFQARENRYSYATREAHEVWAAAMRAIVDPTGKRVADIGCGGGIYSAAWGDLGAAGVVGVDYSRQMVEAAAENIRGRPNVTFREGDALATGLPSASADVVFERALIHHLTVYEACFREAHRVLRPGGSLIVQDRTPDDVRLPGAPEHLRGYFFERFPKLLEAELGRRPTNEAVLRTMQQAGFALARSTTLWETRRRYEAFDDLAQDLRGRVGRSILYKLTDAELAQLVDFIGERLGDGPITERDRWTIWSATKAAV